MGVIFKDKVMVLRSSLLEHLIIKSAGYIHREIILVITDTSDLTLNHHSNVEVQTQVELVWYDKVSLHGEDGPEFRFH